MTTLDLDSVTATSAEPQRRPPRRLRRWTARRLKTAIPAWLGIAVLLVIGVYPVLWLFLSSFKSQREFIQESTFALPESFSFDNYVAAWTTGNIARNFLNSVIVTAPSLTLTLLFGVGAAFAIEVMRWKGRNLTLLLFVSGIMIPGQMILIPLFIAYFKIGISGTYWPMIITYTGLGMPLTVFMMAAFFRAIPREVFEAATIDGASMLRSFFAIGLPMVRNSLFTIGLVQFLRIWNDLLIALTFTTNPDLRPIQAGLLNFSGEYGQINYGPLFAGICINVFGLLILFVVLNRQIMRGLTSGALKG
ncbi:carbohydrate ABC transporter permease [Microlunatus speluncae]|uniref:carbohydrate ABC transporter permease n=1 Tax=Microlunatus speluncae TaxID=2594267 RepID=UPI0012666C8A|nr:carbohydrate ABC transporter permease [Microlunatus speluncae]